MNPVVHLELHTDRAPAAGAFYEALLGWRAEIGLADGIASVLADAAAGTGSPAGISSV